MRKSIILLSLSLLTASLPALEIGNGQIAIDGRWYAPQDSHHWKHAAILGAPVGVIAWLATDGPRPHRYVIAGLAALTVGALYEIDRGKDGSAYIDPADAAWTGLGGLLGAGLSDLTGQTINAFASPEKVALSVAWRF